MAKLRVPKTTPHPSPKKSPKRGAGKSPSKSPSRNVLPWPSGHKLTEALKKAREEWQKRRNAERERRKREKEAAKQARDADQVPAPEPRKYLKATMEEKVIIVRLVKDFQANHGVGVRKALELAVYGKFEHLYDALSQPTFRWWEREVDCRNAIREEELTAYRGKYPPLIIEAFLQKLSKMSDKGILFSVSIAHRACSMLFETMRGSAPDLPPPSRTFVWWLMKQNLYFKTARRGNPPVPPDVLERATRQILQEISYLVKKFAIPESLVVNVDETAARLYPNCGTVREFITRVLYPYYLSCKESQTVPRPPMLLIWDCAPTHISCAMRDMLNEKYSSWLLVVFVPKNCTARLQPLDVALLSGFKTTLKARQEEILINKYEHTAKELIHRPETVKEEFVYAVHNACCAFIPKGDVVRAAWKCLPYGDALLPNEKELKELFVFGVAGAGIKPHANADDEEHQDDACSSLCSSESGSDDEYDD